MSSTDQVRLCVCDGVVDCNESKVKVTILVYIGFAQFFGNLVTIPYGVKKKILCKVRLTHAR